MQIFKQNPFSTTVQNSLFNPSFCSPLSLYLSQFVPCSLQIHVYRWYRWLSGIQDIICKLQTKTHVQKDITVVKCYMTTLALFIKVLSNLSFSCTHTNVSCGALQGAAVTTVVNCLSQGHKNVQENCNPVVKWWPIAPPYMCVMHLCHGNNG